MYANIRNTSSENTPSSIAPVLRSRSSKAISATPFAISPAAMASGASSLMTYALRKDPANLPANGTSVSARIVSGCSLRKSKLSCRPADAKNSGTKNPSAALLIPGMMSRRTWYGSVDRAAPKSSAPSEPCSPAFSAPTTTRNRPPNSTPNDSCGTCRK